MLPLIVATICAGIFAGAAIYITAVEHPARMSCGIELAVREFAPSYHRAAIMQASLAVAGAVAGSGAAWMLEDGWLAVGTLLLGSVVPLTLIVIRPTNVKLMDPDLDSRSRHAEVLLTRWGRLHAIRTALSTASFIVFLARLVNH